MQKNVHDIERWISAAVGAALVTTAAVRRSKSAVGYGLAGALLLGRGASGYCPVYGASGIDTRREGAPNAAIPHDRGISIEKAVTIDKPADELYRFWRQLENLPRFMSHLESVTAIDDRRSHWVARGPGGRSVEWDAEIINEEEGRLLGWKSLPGADIPNAGSVHFDPRPDGRGTALKVILRYDPPGGLFGAKIAKLFGEEPSIQVADDLRRLKQLLETGEVAVS